MSQLSDDLAAFRDEWKEQDLRDEIDQRIIWPVEKMEKHIAEPEALVARLRKYEDEARESLERIKRGEQP